MKGLLDAIKTIYARALLWIIRPALKLNAPTVTFSVGGPVRRYPEVKKPPDVLNPDI